VSAAPSDAAMKARDPASYRALVHPPGARYIEALDQRALPHAVVGVKIGSADAAAMAIRTMWVRGAPLIGAVGAYGLALALDRDAIEWLAAKGYDPAYGARPLKRVIQKELQDPLAEIFFWIPATGAYADYLYASGPTDVWSVGQYATVSQRATGGITVNTSPLFTGSEFNGVWSNGAGTVWVVGGQGTVWRRWP